MPARRDWTVRLSQTAEAEFRGILHWNAAQIGSRQARIYAETLASALPALAARPSQPGVRPRPDIGKGLFTLHVACGGRKGRHFILFRVIDSADGSTIDIVRLLHDSMDLPQHAPPDQV